MASSSKTPAGLSAAGRRFYRSVISEFDLDDHEAAILAEASRTVDLLDDLQAQIDENGLILDSHGGRINPAVVEARQQRLALLKLISALRLPVDVLEDDAPRRPSRASADRS
jgi:hypothetical protein